MPETTLVSPVSTQFGLTVSGDAALSFAAADQATLSAVLRHAESYRRRFTYHVDCQEWADSLISERDADSDRDCLVVSLGSRPVAMVELVHDGSSTLTIALLVVAKNARLSGVGRRVVSCLINAVAGSRFDTLGIGVELENQSALLFWERLGFIETSTIANGRIVTMERWLNHSAARSPTGNLEV